MTQAELGHNRWTILTELGATGLGVWRSMINYYKEEDLTDIYIRDMLNLKDGPAVG